MEFENSVSYREKIEYIIERRPAIPSIEPIEQVSIESEIGLLVLIIGISLIYEWNMFGSIKRLRHKKTIPNPTEIDRGNLEKVYKTVIPEPDFMEEANERALRVGKFYRDNV